MSFGSSKVIARIGDKHDCPRHGDNPIVEGSQSTIDGRGIARVGDKSACGCEIVEGSGKAMIDGRQVAYLGSKTSSGGVIIECKGSASLG